MKITNPKTKAIEHSLNTRYKKIIPRYPPKKSYHKPRQCIKMQRHYFADNGPYGPC